MALSVALYTLLSNNPKFKEFSKRLWVVAMLQLLSLCCCSIIIGIEWIQTIVNTKSSLFTTVSAHLKEVLTVVIVFFFVVSWLILCKIFFTIYGSLYHLRRKRFLKYTKPISWIYEKFIHKTFYESNFRARNTLAFASLEGIDSSKLQDLKKGGSILLLYDDTEDYSHIINNYIKESIAEGDTVDYITTYKSPLDFCRSINETDISIIAKRLSIIDCFSPHYSFDDKVTKYAKQNFTQKGFKFFDAESFADIHTAAI